MNNAIFILFTHQLIYRRLILLKLLLSTAFLPVYAQGYSGNPILPAPAPDPDVIIANGKYYIYPTGGSKFRAYSSTDLTNWTDEGVIFDLGPDCSWADGGGWAPDIVYHNNQYYFYYTAQRRIGVAVGNSPTGPFIDKGSPLIGDNNRFYNGDAIDPEVFVDSDGQAYLYYTNYGGPSDKRMITQRLQPDLISLQGSATNTTPLNYTEASYMLKRNGTYYMMYSNNFFFKDANYNVQYSISSSPTGPWTYGGQILSGNADYLSPGHHAVLKMPGCDEYYIIYHRYDKNATKRSTAIDRMYFNSDGSVRRVEMTNRGVAARLVNGGCNLADGALFYTEFPVGSLAGWTTGGSGIKEISSDGQLRIRDASGSTTNVLRSDFAIPGSYTLEFMAKIDDYTSGTGGESFGVKIHDGAKRLMFRRESDGFYVLNNTNSWVKLKSTSTFNDWADYQIVANNGSATLYSKRSSSPNWNAEGSWTMQNSTAADKTEFWSKATASDAAEFHMEFVRLRSGANAPNVRSATVSFKTAATIIQENIASKIRIYPNPAIGQLQIDLPVGESTTQLSIYDMRGRLVLNTVLSTSESVDISSLPSGLYTLHLQQGGGGRSKKLMIE